MRVPFPPRVTLGRGDVLSPQAGIPLCSPNVSLLDAVLDGLSLASGLCFEGGDGTPYLGGPWCSH